MPRSELDLRDRESRDAASSSGSGPEVVIDAAARVGGILANDTYPSDFLSENLRIQVNLLDAAVESGVERFLFLGSSCIYPRLAPQPIREESLLTGPLEPTNDAYAIAKIAGIMHSKRPQAVRAALHQCDADEPLRPRRQLRPRRARTCSRRCCGATTPPRSPG